MEVFLNNNQKEDLKKVINFGKKWGFGYLIQHLHYAWALKMMEENNFGALDACFAAHMNTEDAKRFGKIGKERLIKFFNERLGNDITLPANVK
jgi:hypothetical protein